MHQFLPENSKAPNAEPVMGCSCDARVYLSSKNYRLWYPMLSQCIWKRGHTTSTQTHCIKPGAINSQWLILLPFIAPKFGKVARTSGLVADRPDRLAPIQFWFREKVSAETVEAFVWYLPQAQTRGPTSMKGVAGNFWYTKMRTILQ